MDQEIPIWLGTQERIDKINKAFMADAKNYEKFKEWFEIVASDTVIELGDGPLIIEEF